MPFKMHKIIKKRSRKNIKKKICVPTLPKIFRPVTRNTLIFLFGLNSIKLNPLCANRNKSCLFSRLLKCLRSLYMANSVDPDQTAPIGAVCSGSTLFASNILNSSVMLGNYLQQTTLADDIFRCIFYLAL